MSSVLRKTATFLEMIKFSHSVFALPFALISMLVAARGIPSFGTLFWIVVAVVGARTAAMCFNRLVDRRFDARNPRTRNRALVTGELSPQFATGALIASALVFYVAAAMLNPLCFYLSTPTLAVLLGYSLTKRFTPFSHIVLGIALGLAPIGAWIAVTGMLSTTPVLLGIAVTLWVAGFDVLYSCQDYDSDRRERELYSLPKAVGIANAMTIARHLHAGAFAFFLMTWMTAQGLGLLFLMGVCATGFLLWRQHQLVRPDDLSKIDAAFFTTNGIISIGLFLIALVDV